MLNILLKVFMYIFAIIALFFNLQSILETGFLNSYNVILLFVSVLIIFYSIMLITNKIYITKTKNRIMIGIIGLSYMSLVYVVNHKYHFSNTTNVILFVPFIIFNMFCIFIFKENWLDKWVYI